MRIDDNAEKNLSNARARKRQRMNPPLLVRDDGVLKPNTPLIAAKPNFRPYHGPTKPEPTREELIAYYNGQAASQRRKVIYQPQEAFDLGKADADDLVNFAFEEYGAVLDGAKPVNELRKQVYELSNMSEAQLAGFKAQSAEHDDNDRPTAWQAENVPGIGDIDPEPAPVRRGRPRRNATAEA